MFQYKSLRIFKGRNSDVSGFAESVVHIETMEPLQIKKQLHHKLRTLQIIEHNNSYILGSDSLEYIKAR